MDLERLRLFGARVLVRPDNPETKTRGGLFIPDNAKKPTNTGVIVAMGPGMLCKDGTRWPMPDVKPGDRVLYNASTLYPTMKFDGVMYTQLHDDDVLAVVEL